MHELKQLADKNDKDRKRLSSILLIFAGLGVIIVGIVAPFFYWYVIMHATCAPSDDFCGMGAPLVILFFSLPCGLIGIVTLLIGIFSSNRE